MRRTNTNSLRRNQSIRYVQNEDERPVLTFGSLDKGDVEEDEERDAVEEVEEQLKDSDFADYSEFLDNEEATDADLLNFLSTEGV